MTVPRRQRLAALWRLAWSIGIFGFFELLAAVNVIVFALECTRFEQKIEQVTSGCLWLTILGAPMARILSPFSGASDFFSSRPVDAGDILRLRWLVAVVCLVVINGALALLWAVKGDAHPVLYAADGSMQAALEHAGWMRRACGKSAAMTCYAGPVAPAWVAVGWADIVTLLTVLLSAPGRYPLAPQLKGARIFLALGGVLPLLAFMGVSMAMPVWLFTGIPWGAGIAVVLTCYGVWRQRVPEAYT